MYRNRWMKVFWDADKGTGGEPAVTETLAEKSNSAPEKDPTGGGKPGENGGGNNKALSLSTEQLNERLERARGAERTALLKELGVEKLEDIQAAVRELADLKKQSMTEAERQAVELKAAQEKASRLEQEVGLKEKARQEAMIRSEAMALMAGKFANPGTAFRLLDLSSVKVKDDGTVEQLAAAVDKLAKDEPWTLAKPGNGKGAAQIGPTNAEAGAGKDSDAERRARYFGTARGGDFFQGGGVKGQG
jgi:hypothetical protein